jgi:DNA-binding NtrC family response regulator
MATRIQTFGYNFPAETHFSREPHPETSALIERGFIGISQWAERTRKLIPRLAATDEVLCLEGEPGTGRALIANLIHQSSSRLPQLLYRYLERS